MVGIVGVEESHVLKRSDKKRPVFAGTPILCLLALAAWTVNSEADVAG